MSFEVRLVTGDVNFRWKFQTLKEAFEFSRKLSGGFKYVNETISEYAPKVELWTGNENITKFIAQ